MTLRASNAVHQSLSVDTEAELGKLTTASLEDGDLVYVRATDQYWRLVKSSTATTSGNVKTCVSGGRWFLCYLAAPGGGFGVATINDLAALDTALMSDGTTVWVESVRSNFVLESTAGTPNTITVVAAYGSTKYWYRSTERSITWAKQATWYVDPITGNDENDGSTALTALESFDEFRRRVYELWASMTVTIVGAAYAGSLIGEFTAKTRGLSLTINGSVTVVANGGTTTTFTDPVLTLGACAMGTATSGAIADFTAYNGKFLRAAGGYFAPILGVVAGAPKLPFWARDTLSNTKPANGTQLDVVDITTVDTIQIAAFGGLALSIYYLKSTSTSFVDAVSVNNDNTVNGVFFFACEFAGYWTSSSSSYAVACLLSGSGVGYFYEPMLFIGGGSKRTFELVDGGRAGFQGFVVNGGAGFKTSSNTSGPNLSSSASIWGGSAGLGVFNSSAAGVAVYSGGFVNGTAIYGASNTTYGMIVDFGGHVQVTTAPTVTGTSGDLQFAGAGTAIPPLSGGVVVPAAVALTTWAQLTGGTFNGHVVSYKNGSALSVG